MEQVRLGTAARPSLGQGAAPGGHARWLGVSVVWPLLCAVALLYGSLLPLDVEWSALCGSPLLGLSEIGWHGTTPDDALTNVLVYVPLGICLFVSRVGIACGAFGMLVSVVVGVALSVSAEYLQTGIAERVASWTDVLLNSFGTTVGVIAGALAVVIAPRGAQRVQRQWADNPFAPATLALTFGLFLYALVPFDWVTTTPDLHAAFQRAWLGVAFAGHGSTPAAGTLDLAGEIAGAAWFVLLGFMAAHASPHRKRRPELAFATAVQHAWLTAGLIEMVQVFTVSHAFGAGSMMLRWAGAAVGAWYAAFVVDGATSRGRELRWSEVVSPRLLTGAIVFQLAMAGWAAVSRGSAGSVDVPYAAAHWIPLETLWRLPASQALAELASLAVLYGALTATVGLMMLQRGWSRPWLTATSAVLLVAVVFECLTVASTGAGFDTTTPVTAALIGSVPWLMRRDARSLGFWLGRGAEPA